MTNVSNQQQLRPTDNWALRMKGMQEGKVYYQTADGSIISVDAKSKGAIYQDDNGAVSIHNMDNVSYYGSSENNNVSIYDSDVREVKGGDGNDNIQLVNCANEQKLTKSENKNTESCLDLSNQEKYNQLVKKVTKFDMLRAEEIKLKQYKVL